MASNGGHHAVAVCMMRRDRESSCFRTYKADETVDPQLAQGSTPRDRLPVWRHPAVSVEKRKIKGWFGWGLGGGLGWVGWCLEDGLGGVVW